MTFLRKVSFPLLWLATLSPFAVAENKRPDAAVPVTQNREVYGKETWLQRHETVVAYNARVKPALIFIGDSITHFWGGEPATYRANGADSWAKLTGGLPATNAGFGFDYIENAAWRVDHGELDGVSPKVIVILLGTNNLGHKHDEPADCERGMKALLAKITAKCPASKILLLGILPRGADCAKSIAETNARYAKLAGSNVVYSQIGDVLGEPGKGSGVFVSKKEYFKGDGLHPDAAGYEKLAEVLAPVISDLAAPPKAK